MKKRKTTIDKKRVSKHTLRFRASTGPAVPMRSMASVGGMTRRAMKKRQRVNMSGLRPVAMLPAWMQTGLAAFEKIAQAMRAKYEASKRKASA